MCTIQSLEHKRTIKERSLKIDRLSKTQLTIIHKSKGSTKQQSNEATKQRSNKATTSKMSTISKLCSYYKCDEHICTNKQGKPLKLCKGHNNKAKENNGKARAKRAAERAAEAQAIVLAEVRESMTAEASVDRSVSIANEVTEAKAITASLWSAVDTYEEDTRRDEEILSRTLPNGLTESRTVASTHVVRRGVREEAKQEQKREQRLTNIQTLTIRELIVSEEGMSGTMSHYKDAVDTSRHLTDALPYGRDKCMKTFDVFLFGEMPTMPTADMMLIGMTIQSETEQRHDSDTWANPILESLYKEHRAIGNRQEARMRINEDDSLQTVLPYSIVRRWLARPIYETVSMLYPAGEEYDDLMKRYVSLLKPLLEFIGKNRTASKMSKAKESAYAAYDRYNLYSKVRMPRLHSPMICRLEEKSRVLALREILACDHSEELRSARVVFHGHLIDKGINHRIVRETPVPESVYTEHCVRRNIPRTVGPYVEQELPKLLKETAPQLIKWNKANPCILVTEEDMKNKELMIEYEVKQEIAKMVKQHEVGLLSGFGHVLATSAYANVLAGTGPDTPGDTEASPESAKVISSKIAENATVTFADGSTKKFADVDPETQRDIVRGYGVSKLSECTPNDVYKRPRMVVDESTGDASKNIPSGVKWVGPTTQLLVTPKGDDPTKVDRFGKHILQMTVHWWSTDMVEHVMDGVRVCPAPPLIVALFDRKTGVSSMVKVNMLEKQAAGNKLKRSADLLGEEQGRRKRIELESSQLVDRGFVGGMSKSEAHRRLIARTARDRQMSMDRRFAERAARFD
jgi:hypothetical protein